jgi:hypothetical protein
VFAVAVYGDQLAFFPELLEERVVFKMDPKLGAGYGPRYNERRVTGYFSWIKGGKMGIEGDLRTENQNATLWVLDDTDGRGIVEQGDYLEEDGCLFVVNHDDGFFREGGFQVCALQLVPAFTDRQQSDEGVNLGAKDFY